MFLFLYIEKTRTKYSVFENNLFDSRKKKYAQGGTPLTLALRLLPTVLARDYRSGKGNKERHGKHSPGLPEVLTAEVGGENGLLSPRFAEWMMGWPIGFSGLEPLGTDKFQSWLQQHGGC